MEPVFIVILLALIEYMVFGGLVGRARGIHGVKAPAISGPEAFDRTFRAHQNTLENIVIFVPAVWIFGTYVHPLWAAGLGIVYIIGRALYVRGYIAEAEKRGVGGAMSGLTIVILILGGLIGVIIRLL